MYIFKKRQSIGKNSSHNQQAGRDIYNGISARDIYDIIDRELDVKLGEVSKSLCKQMNEDMKKFIKDYVAMLDNQSEIDKFVNCMEDGRKHLLFVQSCSNSTRFKNTCDEELLIDAVRNALETNSNNELFSIMEDATLVIPKLTRSELLSLVYAFYMQLLVIPIEMLEGFTEKLFDSKLTGELTGLGIQHLESLSLFSFNQFSTGKAEEMFLERYGDKGSDLLNNEDVPFIKRMLQGYDAMNLIQYNITITGAVIAELVIKQVIPSFKLNYISHLRDSYNMTKKEA